MNKNWVLLSTGVVIGVWLAGSVYKKKIRALERTVNFENKKNSSSESKSASLVLNDCPYEVIRIESPV